MSSKGSTGVSEDSVHMSQSSISKIIFYEMGIMWKEPWNIMIKVLLPPNQNREIADTFPKNLPEITKTQR